MKIWFQNRRSKYKKVLKQGPGAGTTQAVEKMDELESAEDEEGSHSTSDEEATNDDENNQIHLPKVKQEQNNLPTTPHTTPLTPLTQPHIEQGNANMVQPAVVTQLHSTAPHHAALPVINNNNHSSPPNLHIQPNCYNPELLPTYANVQPTYNNGVTHYNQLYNPHYNGWNYQSNSTNAHSQPL